MIYAHRLRRGATPSERNIAETYGVSRTIVREALLMLELQGTVDIRQGSGVYVMRIPHEDDSEEEQMLSSDVGPFEILQARQLLESNIAAFAANMATRALSSRSSGPLPPTIPARITPVCFTWCWPGRRKIRCCWRRSSVSGCRWTAARCGSSSTCISPAGRTG